MSIRGWVSAGIILVVVAGWLLIMLVGEERLPLGVANGSYANDCCGVMTLSNGKMSVGGHWVSYVIERDKNGPYILPSAYVGVAGGSAFEVDRNRYALKLYLDDAAKPQTVELMSTTESYSFVRRH